MIEVPLANPSQARIVNQPRIFANETGDIAGLWQGGDHGANTQRSRMTNQCHDITVYSEIGLAAGACSGNGILMDINDPRNPKRLDAVTDPGFAYWHSATFNNDGTKVLFTDEWGGGGWPRCRATDPLTWGADAIYDIVNGKLVVKGYYKMPAAQTEQENCVAHNGSLIPVPGRDIMVQAWYQGGLSVFDFTDSANAKEIAYFDRGPINGESHAVGRLLVDVLVQRQPLRLGDGARHRRVPPEAERTPVAERDRRGDAVPAAGVQLAEPAEGGVAADHAVAKAYVDQLNRTKGISAERVRAINEACRRWTDCAPARKATPRPRSTRSMRWRRRLRQTASRSPASTRSGTRRSPRRCAAGLLAYARRYSRGHDAYGGHGGHSVFPVLLRVLGSL